MCRMSSKRIRAARRTGCSSIAGGKLADDVINPLQGSAHPFIGCNQGVPERKDSPLRRNKRRLAVSSAAEAKPVRRKRQ